MGKAFICRRGGTTGRKPDRITPEFTYSGDFRIVDDYGAEISDFANWKDNWKIEFITSGTLKFTNFHGWNPEIDVFCVGGGSSGSGGGAFWGGGGGAGGRTAAGKAITVELNKAYTITIGSGGTAVSGSGSSNGSPKTEMPAAPLPHLAFPQAAVRPRMAITERMAAAAAALAADRPAAAMAVPTAETVKKPPTEKLAQVVAKERPPGNLERAVESCMQAAQKAEKA